MKALVKILAVFGAIAAVAALLYHFRDKLKALCPCCGKCDEPITDEPAQEQEVLADEPAEAAAEVTEEVAEEVVEEVAEAAEEVAEEPASDVTAEDFVEET